MPSDPKTLKGRGSRFSVLRVPSCPSWLKILKTASGPHHHRNARYTDAPVRDILATLNRNPPMPEPRPLTFLCITTYEKGQDFMRECKRQGCRVILLTAEKLRDADWPHESLDETFYLPAELPLPEIVQAVTHLARSKKID